MNRKDVIIINTKICCLCYDNKNCSYGLVSSYDLWTGHFIVPELKSGCPLTVEINGFWCDDILIHGDGGWYLSNSKLGRNLIDGIRVLYKEC